MRSCVEERGNESEMKACLVSMPFPHVKGETSHPNKNNNTPTKKNGYITTRKFSFNHYCMTIQPKV